MRLLARGTYGRVYLHTHERVLTAVKEVAQTSTPDMGVSVTAIREVRILRILNHENITRLLHVWMDRDSVYIAMEFLPMSLRQLLWNGQPILLHVACTYLQHLLRGLQHCHDRRILHRDLKPENLLIGVDGRLKLADFGASHSVPPWRSHIHARSNADSLFLCILQDSLDANTCNWKCRVRTRRGW